MNRKKIKGNQIILDKSDWIWKIWIIWINWIIKKKKKSPDAVLMKIRRFCTE